MEMTFLDVPAVPTSSPHAHKTKRLEWLCPGAACCAAVVDQEAVDRGHRAYWDVRSYIERTDSTRTSSRLP